MKNIELNQERIKNPVELVVGEPVGGLHTWEINYTCADKALSLAYNRAIKEICDREKLGPFLQSEDSETGYCAWEMIGGEVSREILENLILEIHENVRCSSNNLD